MITYNPPGIALSQKRIQASVTETLATGFPLRHSFVSRTKIIMALTPTDVARLAELARLEIDGPALEAMQAELNEALGFIQTLQAVDTDGVAPLVHPLNAIADISLRLRDDVAAPTMDVAERDELMANAPEQKDGLFLVPRVIE